MVDAVAPTRRRRLAARLETSWGIGVLAFAEALFLPIPIEAALGPMMIHKPEKRWLFALYALIGSVLGIAALYGIGLVLMDTIGARVIALNGWQGEYAGLHQRFEEDGAATVAVIAVTPIPFTLAALAAGAARMNVLVFLLVAGATRGARYAVLAALVGVFGDRVRIWYERVRRDPRSSAVSLSLIAIGAAVLAWLWFVR